MTSLAQRKLDAAPTVSPYSQPVQSAPTVSPTVSPYSQPLQSAPTVSPYVDVWQRLWVAVLQRLKMRLDAYLAY